MIWMGKKTSKSSNVMGCLDIGNILATTIDFDAKTVMWKNESKNTTITENFADLGSGGEWHFSILFYK